MSGDGGIIYMNNFENPNLLNKEMPDGIEPHLTFINLPHTDYYQFAGVYARKRRDNILGWIYERIAKYIDTKDYL